MTRLERRRLLASVGAGIAVGGAGCLTDMVTESDDSPREFDPDELDPILSEDVPAVDPPAPVQPSDAAVADALEELDDLLATVPDPLQAEDVPNEAVRNRIDQIRERARNGRESLEDSPNRFHTLLDSVTARRDAGTASAAFVAVDGDLTRSDVEDDRDAVRTRLEDRRTGLGAIGDQIQRTLLLQYHLESELAAAERWLDNRPRDRSTGVVAIGEIAGAVERARAAIAAVEELERGHVDRLDDERSFDWRIEDALERSRTAIESADVPERWDDVSERVDADLSDTVGERVLDEGWRTAAGTSTRVTDGTPATALRSACAFERDRRAFEAIRTATEAGDHRTIEDVEDVRVQREAALERAEATSFDPADPSLGGDLLAETYRRLEIQDRKIREDIEQGYRSNLFRPYANYVLIDAQLEALPDAVAVLEDRLE